MGGRVGVRKFGDEEVRVEGVGDRRLGLGGLRCCD